MLTTYSRAPEVNVLEGWQFDRESAGWRWGLTHPSDGTQNRSTRTFATLLECIYDAVRNGYVIDDLRWRLP